LKLPFQQEWTNKVYPDISGKLLTSGADPGTGKIKMGSSFLSIIPFLSDTNTYQTEFGGNKPGKKNPDALPDYNRLSPASQLWRWGFIQPLHPYDGPDQLKLDHFRGYGRLSLAQSTSFVEMGTGNAQPRDGVYTMGSTDFYLVMCNQ